MKLRLFSLCTALCLALSLTGPALAADGDTQLETVRVLGILSGDESGDLNLNASVTRAEFVKMMAAASVYKDAVGGGSASLFTDVKSGHWAGGYIQLAVEQGWVTGYVDGSFRPENTITLEEACTALLRLLGYDSSSLTGSFPQAQLSKAGSVGLLDGLSAAQGDALTRQDCVTLFYNLLVGEDSSGAVYGTTLGYTVTNGEVDYSTLVTSNTEGPFVASDGTVSLPFSSENVTVYRNGLASTLDSASQYDVYYYSEALRTVWLYSSRVTGTLTAVSPSTAAPTSVTVAGGTDSLGTSDAIYQFSSQGDFSAGDTVTLLLGMNGEVVQAVTAAEANTVYYGVVLSSEKSAADSSTSSSSGTNVQIATVVACTDGTERTFYHNGTAYSAGRLVTVTASDSGSQLSSLSGRSLEGTVSSDGASFAGYAFASDVQILDTDSEGGYARIYPSRIAGCHLDSGDVRYYSLDENGDLDRLILEEATGDTFVYVYLTAAERQSGDLSVGGTYTYLLNGDSYTISGSTAYSIRRGGAVLDYHNGELENLRQLESVALTQLSDLYAVSDGQTYLLDESVQVLLRDTSTTRGYYATTLSDINAEDYTLTGWYDDLGFPAGGRIRILVAVPK